MGEPMAGPLALLPQVVHGVADPVRRAVAGLMRPDTYSAQLREAAAAAVTVGLWPLGLGAPVLLEDRRDPRGGEGATQDVPVLLVHGYGANRSNWQFVERRLRSAGCTSVHAVNYNPLTSDLPGLADWFTGQVASLRDRLGVENIHVVGHSLGGIVARYAIQVLGAEGIATCVTLASPHGGVALVRRVRPLPGGLGAVARQLRPDSPEMVLLRSSARPLSTRFVAYAGGADLVVPSGRAIIREPELGATNLVVAHHGHFSLLFSSSLANSLVHQLGREVPPVPEQAQLPAAA